MANIISSRADIVTDWKDFLLKYLIICGSDEYHEEENPNGYINLGTTVNILCGDMIYSKLKRPDIWMCDMSALQYKEVHGTQRLREVLARLMTTFLKPHEAIQPDDLFCVAGVTASIDLLSHCLADDGDVFLVPTPVYGRVYTDMIQRSGVKMWPVPIISRYSTADNSFLTVEKIKKAYDDAVSQNQVVRGLFLVSPGNPLGDVYSPELLMDILNFCHERSLHVIADEVYALSVFSDEVSFHSILKFPKLPDPDRTHILYGISKDFGIAGLRVGIIHTKCKPLQNCLKELSFFQNIPFPVMEIVSRYFEDLEWCKTYVAENISRLKENYWSCVKQVENMGLQVRYSQSGYFVFADFRSVCGYDSFDAEKSFFQYLIEEARLYVAPGQEFFCEQPGWFRIIFTCNPNHVKEGLNRLARAIKKYKTLLPSTKCAGPANCARVMSSSPVKDFP